MIKWQVLLCRWLEETSSAWRGWRWWRKDIWSGGRISWEEGFCDRSSIVKYFNIIKYLLNCLCMCTLCWSCVRFWQQLGSEECLIQHLANMLSCVRLMNQFTIEISSLTQIAGVLCRNVTKSFLQKANLHPIKPLQLHRSKFSALLCDDIQSWPCWRPLRPMGQVLRS